MLDAILAAGKQTIGVGKIHDIFAGKGIGGLFRTSGNTEGLQVTLELADRDFEGLAFVNLVDFDMLYGHRHTLRATPPPLPSSTTGCPALWQKCARVTS